MVHLETHWARTQQLAIAAAVTFAVEVERAASVDERALDAGECPAEVMVYFFRVYLLSVGAQRMFVRLVEHLVRPV